MKKSLILSTCVLSLSMSPLYASDQGDVEREARMFAHYKQQKEAADNAKLQRLLANPNDREIQSLPFELQIKYAEMLSEREKHQKLQQAFEIPSGVELKVEGIDNNHITVKADQFDGIPVAPASIKIPGISNRIYVSVEGKVNYKTWYDIISKEAIKLHPALGQSGRKIIIISKGYCVLNENNFKDHVPSFGASELLLSYQD